MVRRLAGGQLVYCCVLLRRRSAVWMHFVVVYLFHLSAGFAQEAIRETPESKPEYTKSVAEYRSPVPSRRFMIFVPDAVPHFLLVCDEQAGWSVRDYSSGQVRLLPARALGRPIDEIVAAPKHVGCLAFQAPRVSISNQNFWKTLTDELGQRFLASKTSRLIAVSSGGYPVVAEAEFLRATAHLTAFERERILRSPRSQEWTVWNAMQLLMEARPAGWWNDVGREAAVLNPGNQFSYGVGPPGVEFWKPVGASSAYDQWRRVQMAQSPRNGREKVRAMDSKPLELPTRVDMAFDGGSWLVFAESGVRMGMRTAEDPRRNRLVQLADCLMTEAKGRPCALWVLGRDRSPEREYVQLVERYRSSPEMFAAELPYHPAEALYKLAQRLTVLRWSDVVGGLVARQVSDDPVMARVRKELGRRIQGVAMGAAAGAGG